MSSQDPRSWECIPPAEVLALKCKTHTASIRMAQVDEGWSWAADCSRLTGDVSGWSEPLGRRGGHIDPGRLAPTREAALEAAADRIRSRLPDKPILEWLDGLSMVQPDLFGAAA